MTTELAALLAAARTEANALMCDSCTIQHPTGVATDDDGHTTTTFATVYAGRCRVQLRGTAAAQSVRNVGDQQIVLLIVELQIPVDTTGIAVRDLVTITDAEYDADLIGRRFRVADLMHKTHATMRRLQCQEVTG